MESIFCRSKLLNLIVLRAHRESSTSIPICGGFELCGPFRMVVLSGLSKDASKRTRFGDTRDCVNDPHRETDHTGNFGSDTRRLDKHLAIRRPRARARRNGPNSKRRLTAVRLRPTVNPLGVLLAGSASATSRPAARARRRTGTTARNWADFD